MFFFILAIIYKYIYVIKGTKKDYIMRIYITFDTHHTHCINGTTYDDTCIAMIDARSAKDGIRLAHAHFHDDFDCVYDEDAFRAATAHELSNKQLIIIK